MKLFSNDFKVRDERLLLPLQLLSRITIKVFHLEPMVEHSSTWRPQFGKDRSKCKMKKMIEPRKRTRRKTHSLIVRVSLLLNSFYIRNRSHPDLNWSHSGEQWVQSSIKWMKRPQIHSVLLFSTCRSARLTVSEWSISTRHSPTHTHDCVTFAPSMNFVQEKKGISGLTELCLRKGRMKLWMDIGPQSLWMHENRSVPSWTHWCVVTVCSKSDNRLKVLSK